MTVSQYSSWSVYEDPFLFNAVFIMPELCLFALRAVVCIGFWVSSCSSDYGSKSVCTLNVAQVAFLNGFVVAIAALLPGQQILNCTGPHPKWEVIVIAVLVTVCFFFFFFPVAFLIAGKVGVFWVIIWVLVLRKLKGVIAKVGAFLHIILEVWCFVFTDYDLLINILLHSDIFVCLSLQSNLATLQWNV